jgi:hypothetical protein
MKAGLWVGGGIKVVGWEWRVRIRQGHWKCRSEAKRVVLSVVSVG